MPKFSSSHTPSPSPYSQPSAYEMTWGERIERGLDQLVVATMVAGSLSVGAAITEEVHDNLPVICEEANYAGRSIVQELNPQGCTSPEDGFLWKSVEFVAVPAEKAATILRNGLDNIVIRFTPEFNELSNTDITEYMCADSQAPAGALCSENQPMTAFPSRQG